MSYIVSFTKSGLLIEVLVEPLYPGIR